MAETGTSDPVSAAPPKPRGPRHASPAQGQTLAWLGIVSAVLVAVVALAAIVVLIWPTDGQRPDDRAADRRAPAGQATSSPDARPVTSPAATDLRWVGLLTTCPKLDVSQEAIINEAGEGRPTAPRTSDDLLTAVECAWSDNDTKNAIRSSVYVYKEAADPTGGGVGAATRRFTDERAEAGANRPEAAVVVEETSVRWDQAFAWLDPFRGKVNVVVLTRNAVVTVTAQLDRTEITDRADIRDALFARYRPSMRGLAEDIVDDLR